MRKVLWALVAVLAGGVAARASEPAGLDGLGLGDIQAISESEGTQVRGLAASSSASGLSSLGAIFYDTSSGSKANIDLVNFSAGGEDGGAPGDTVSAQNFNAIGSTTALEITFPGAAAGLSAFSAGGSSQSQANGTVTPFTVPAPATFVP